ncbi:exosome nuclease subunit [Pseudogymnoascus australis]
MEAPPAFKSLQDAIQAALISTTRTVSQISAEDLGFHRSLNPEVGTALDEQNARLLGLSSSILQSAAALTESNAPELQEVDDVDNNWRGVVDVVDSLLERADTCLDEYTGVIKRKASPAEQSSAPKSRRLDNSFRTQNLVKPQLSFLNKPANHENGPWKPLIHSKPHAIVPLEESLGPVMDDHQQEHYRHPYETEIEKLKYPASLYKKADPIPYLPVESTSATFVDTYEGVLEMLAELRTAKEIAIDLEHHDARSYIGLVSLMQISTREKDWIVDTLKPWRQDLQVLNEVFTDPKILKVLHGAFMDILWLQRDLGLYIVGLFDTNHACKALGYAGGSLAFLLKKFIDFDADKKYQMADWRIRPLPEGMFFYARADTHFLLYIYDHMRNELLERPKPPPPQKAPSTSSSANPKRRPYSGPGGWFQALVKVPTLLSNEQFGVFRAVHAWRDKIARQDDDSTNFVMPNHTLLSVAKVMPTDMASLLGTVHPISHNVKARTGELLEIIKAAKANAKDGPSMMEVLKPDSVGAVAAANARSLKAAGAGKQSILTILSGETSSDMRSPQSAFWGHAFGSSTWEEPSTLTKAGDEIRLAIPLPPLAEEAFSEGMREYSTLAQPEVPEPAEEEEVEPPVVEEPAFTIKGGRKRKSEDMEAEAEPEASEEGENTTSPLTNPWKAPRRRKRKAAKKAAKAAKRGESSTGGRAAREEEEEEEEPFDYSKAESVLNKKRTAGEFGKGKKGGAGKKPFDPYQKSADAATGMRRLQTERPGKSFTFKG